MPKPRKMKLFVWNDGNTLGDFKHGMIVAVAPDLESALKAIEAECNYCMNSFDNANPTQVIELPTEPKAFVCYGSE